MRLLLDQNLSPRLLDMLADLYPGSTHVRNEGLQATDDDAVWAYATQHGFAIVSKDADYHQRSFVFGQPPKVIWIRLGNCSTDEIAALLRRITPTFSPSSGARRRRFSHSADPRSRGRAVPPSRGARPPASVIGCPDPPPQGMALGSLSAAADTG